MAHFDLAVCPAGILVISKGCTAESISRVLDWFLLTCQWPLTWFSLYQGHRSWPCNVNFLFITYSFCNHFFYCICAHSQASQRALVVQNLPASAEDARELGWISGLGRPPGEGNGNPLRYSCLRNPMDRRAWRATVHEVTKSTQPGTWLSMHAHTCTFSLVRKIVQSLTLCRC